MENELDVQGKLLELQNELQRLKSAADLIDETGRNSGDLAKKCVALAMDCEHYLKRYQGVADEFIDKTMKETEASLEATKGTLVGLNENVATMILQLREASTHYQQMANGIDGLTQKLKEIDFPTRLDKLDTSISTVAQASQNIVAGIADSERRLSDGLKEIKKENSDNLNEVRKENSEAAKAARKNIIISTVVTVVAIAIAVAVIIK